jgi:hypothetical protein
MRIAIELDDLRDECRARRHLDGERCISLLHYAALCQSCAESTRNVHALGGQLYCERCCPACIARARLLGDDCFTVYRNLRSLIAGKGPVT